MKKIMIILKNNQINTAQSKLNKSLVNENKRLK